MGDDFITMSFFTTKCCLYTSACKDKKQWAAPNQY